MGSHCKSPPLHPESQSAPTPNTDQQSSSLRFIHPFTDKCLRTYCVPGFCRTKTDAVLAPALVGSTPRPKGTACYPILRMRIQRLGDLRDFPEATRLHQGHGCGPHSGVWHHHPLGHLLVCKSQSRGSLTHQTGAEELVGIWGVGGTSVHTGQAPECQVAGEGTRGAQGAGAGGRCLFCPRGSSHPPGIKAHILLQSWGTFSTVYLPLSKAHNDSYPWFNTGLEQARLARPKTNSPRSARFPGFALEVNPP